MHKERKQFSSQPQDNSRFTIQASRARELEEMFPIIDPQAKPTTKPSIFVSLLWKQLNHLGNAGFDPALFRVEPYGNVLYYHADLASPLAWDINHWFPCSSTLPSLFSPLFPIVSQNGELSVLNL
ncbi:hypothetical protein Droror1_Dr00026365 [Drosera rotundifolia]